MVVLVLNAEHQTVWGHLINTEYQLARGAPHRLLTLEKAISSGVPVHSGGDDLRLRVL